MKKWLLYDQDAGDATGGGKGGGDAAAQAAAAALTGAGDKPPATIDLTAKVKMADGREVAVGELVDAYGKAESLTAQNAGLQETVDGVRSLFDENTPPEAREKATRHILSEAGYAPDEIDYYLELTGAPGGQEGDEGGGSGGEADPRDAQIAELQKEVGQNKANQHKARVRELEVTLEGHLEKTLDSNKTLKVLFERTMAMQPADASAEDKQKALTRAKSAIRQQLRRQTLEQLQLRRTRAGTFEDRWFGEEVEKAVEPVLDTYQAVIGDINRLGRTPETGAGGDALSAEMQQLLSKDPVAKPGWKAGEDNASNLTNWAVDSLVRAGTKGSGETSKV